MNLREWLAAEYQRAATAAERARLGRRPGGPNPQALEHASAVARMCALGETLAHLHNPTPIDHGGRRAS